MYTSYDYAHLTIIHQSYVPLVLPVESIQSQNADQQTVLLWDRKVEGGFPEAKVLKQRLRDHIEPGKSLGHSDVAGHSKKVKSTPDPIVESQNKEVCEDCG
jgi:hypothetical protein